MGSLKKFKRRRRVLGSSFVSNSRSATKLVTKNKVKSDHEDEDCIIVEPQEEILEIHNIGDDKKCKKTSRGTQASLFYEDVMPHSLISKTQIPVYKLLELTGLIGDMSIENRKETFNTTTTLVTTSDRTDNNQNSSLTTNDKNYEENNKNDDSVVFVGEEILLDDHLSKRKIVSSYPIVESISLIDNQINQINSPSSSNMKIKKASYSQQLRKTSNSLTAKDHKISKTNNNNINNPNKNNNTTKRMIIVDGNNVAYGHSLNKEFSVRGLELCINYFKNLGHEVKAVVPQNRLRRTKSSDPLLLQRLHREGVIVLTPCKNLPGKCSTSYDDRFILQVAAELDAAVISNDNYRDLLNEDEVFRTVIENRVIGYTWCNDNFFLPKDPYGRFGPSLQTILNRT